ncbi:MAG: hypothetical protein LBT09_00480 [Planctomycetaceae bacterium]|jgi:hypothetical protein|nr:hypothetical protein [Planctomycetaceae bacterium]
MNFLLFVGDPVCHELAPIGFLFEQRSTGITVRRAACLYDLVALISVD